MDFLLPPEHNRAKRTAAVRQARPGAGVSQELATASAAQDTAAAIRAVVGQSCRDGAFRRLMFERKGQKGQGT